MGCDSLVSHMHKQQQQAIKSKKETTPAATAIQQSTPEGLATATLLDQMMMRLHQLHHLQCKEKNRIISLNKSLLADSTLLTEVVSDEKKIETMVICMGRFSGFESVPTLRKSIHHRPPSRLSFTAWCPDHNSA